ncbi:unnamed protein product [Clonostachys chloroleuca]|uniref:Outer spore wall protein RRT8 n=1 Tax=Clonostachys chloroleuca TaxID=1926264 RepID=A0AA35MD12_9HYPO|nr:unnamed protein product [Clonostachys chloroleuca]
MADAAQSSGQTSKGNRIVDSVRNNAQDVIKEDYTKAKTLAFEAAKSRAWLYPLKVQILDLPSRSLTVLLVLNESTAIVNGISRNFLLEDAILDTFDGTLLSRNKGEIVKEGREIKSGSDPIQKLGKALKKPFERFGPKAIIRYFMYLPLNFIPIVGTVLFIFLQSKGRGHQVHNRYFQLKKWSPSQRSQWLGKHVGPYTSFGLVATLLEMIPVASMFFTFTNTVGAALWAADIEAMNTSMTDETAPTIQGSANKSS